MDPWLGTYLRGLLQRYLGNERGQDVLTWLLVLIVLWLIFTGRRVVVQ